MPANKKSAPDKNERGSFTLELGALGFIALMQIATVPWVTWVTRELSEQSTSIAVIETTITKMAEDIDDNEKKLDRQSAKNH